MVRIEYVGWDCRTSLEGRHEFAVGFGFTLRPCALQNTLGYSLWTSPCSHPKSRVL